jgi:hypothetical protein
MGQLTRARAWCNNEVAYLAWKADGPIAGCLGFMITRELLDAGGKVAEARILPTWVAFKGQSNPDWEEQDMSVWPAQKFSWRDLTLRRSRNTRAVRPADLTVRYRVEPVGLKVGNAKPVEASKTAQPGKYTGKKIALYYCGDAIHSNVIQVTQVFGEITAAFNNGILSTQNLRKQLKTKKGEVPSKAIVLGHIDKPGDELRTFLAGDALPCLRELFARAESRNGQIHAALYELSDPELIGLLKASASRLHLILCTAGKDARGNWDTTNADARKLLHPLLGDRMQDRMFNNSAHIGHNKFAVLVVGGKAQAVWTGSTNWTPTGLCGQTNNTVVVRNAAVADLYWQYWKRLWADKLPVPRPISAPNNTNQGLVLRHGDMAPAGAKLDGGATRVDTWFSPNTETTGSSKTRTVPVDLKAVYDLMKKAKDAIFFLVFNPGRTSADGEDVNTVVSAAINFGRHDPDLLVMGAISDPTAVPGYEAPPRPPAGQKKPKTKSKEPKVPLPAIFSPAGLPKVLMIRAAALKDVIGDFQKELLKVGTAIIHDKVVVIDPLSPDCTVITGSHNLGFKASYANDENMLVIQGNQALAQAYAVHVMDVYEHYRFRAVQEQQLREAMLKNGGKPPKQKTPTGGFLEVTPDWQKPYFDGTKGEDAAYFVK